MNRRTYILALALTVSEDAPVLPADADTEDTLDYMNAYVENATVAGILDRTRPGNNLEAQIFADYYEGPNFTEGMNEAVPMEGRAPNCCDPGFSDAEYPNVNLDGYNGGD